MMHEIKVSHITNLVTVVSYKTDLVNDKIVRVILNESEEMTRQQAVTYMMSLGVDSMEIATAFDEMEQNGHNMANFGAMGNFMFSRYDGILH
jgi:hypothetical protein